MLQTKNSKSRPKREHPRNSKTILNTQVLLYEFVYSHVIKLILKCPKRPGNNFVEEKTNAQRGNVNKGMTSSVKTNQKIFLICKFHFVG